MSDPPESPSPRAAVATAAAAVPLDPRVEFPPGLPITERLAELARAIADHQVVIVAGETGSGKTTQLPKLCLAMGRAARGQIACTQPRRIAATSVAQRVAQELHTELGDVVGYKIRFGDRVKRTSAIKFVTDGMLLAELQGDPMLRAYDTIIVDEAHERSLNIDFLLGVLQRLLPKRPELRVIVSSATLETARFSRFFGDAPVIEVSGRTFPVEVLYRPPRDDEAELADLVANVVDEITDLDPRGDVLVFLPGEREIREAAAELEQRALPHTVILPLYARLAAADQQRVFQVQAQRRVVLATNVAETSLTIPGIIYVVDAGLARLNRYDVRTGVTRLLVEPVSQASADQRKGRCGRTESGICFRLYEEQDFVTRPAHTDPEIKRVGLAGVILRMKALRLGELEQFPLLDVPHKRAVDEGYRVLEELGALDDDGRLTRIGHELGRMPLDPRLGRMILGGRDEGALREVVVIAAAIGLRDPRERPQGAEQRADEAHRAFRDEGSDFVAYLKLWTFWQEARARGTKARLSKLCRDHFLSYPRMREWEELHAQLVRVMRELDLGPNDTPATGEQLHRALLPGLLSKIGMWNQEARCYVGARQIRFKLHPSSALARKPPAWVMAAELVETSQLFARTAAKIDPGWIERAAGPLCKRSHGEPHWEMKQGQVVAREQVTLYGLPIVRDRKVAYAPFDPAMCREVFITHALVRHEYATRAPFFAHNQRLLEEVARARDKARRSDMFADEDALWRFFDERLPAEVVSAKAFEAWRRDAEARDPEVLHLTRDDILLEEAHDLSPARYPDQLVIGGVALPLTYRFEPSEDDDGVTATVPLAALPQLDPEVMAWTIPGWHEAKLRALLDGLPKAHRRALAPVDELARTLAAELRPFDGPMLATVERAIYQRVGERVPRDAWDLRAVPAHLDLWFRVVDDRERVLAQGRDLAELQRGLGQRARALWASAPRSTLERTGLTTWDLDALPASVTLEVGGRSLLAYPALVEGERGVDLRLLESAAAADAATRAGVRRLFLLQLSTTLARLEALHGKPLGSALAVAGAPAPPGRQLVVRALDEAFALMPPAPLPRTKAAFFERLAAGERQLPITLRELGALAAALGVEVERVRAALKPLAARPGPTRAAVDDIQAQLRELVTPELLAVTAMPRLVHLTRYLKAIGVRVQRLAHDPIKDQHKAAQVAPWVQRLRQRRARGDGSAALDEFGWLLEELRVQVFAPELKAAVSVSPQRLEEAWARL
ncbi:MAG: ATP-dependent RNA helicase HrpA [Kofleriaceae bacterium]